MTNMIPGIVYFDLVSAGGAAFDFYNFVILASCTQKKKKKKKRVQVPLQPPMLQFIERL